MRNHQALHSYLPYCSDGEEGVVICREKNQVLHCYCFALEPWKIANKREGREYPDSVVA